MNKQTEALKLALEALQSDLAGQIKKGPLAITAIKEALAEQPAQQRPQNCGTGYCSCIECLFEQPATQEPVAWITKNGKGWLRWHKPEDSEKNKDSIPLYTSPPASKPWVGLTDDEFQMIYDLGRTPAGMMELVEAKLKEKNA